MNCWCCTVWTDLLGMADGNFEENRDKALDAEEIAQFLREENSCSTHPTCIKVSRNCLNLSDLFVFSCIHSLAGLWLGRLYLGLFDPKAWNTLWTFYERLELFVSTCSILFHFFPLLCSDPEFFRSTVLPTALRVPNLTKTDTKAGDHWNGKSL